MKCVKCGKETDPIEIVLEYTDGDTQEVTQEGAFSSSLCAECTISLLEESKLLRRVDVDDVSGGKR